MAEAQTRMVNELESLRAKHEGETVAMVSHADVIRAVVLHALEMRLDLFWRIEISPASVSVLELNDWGPKLLALNIT